MRFLLSLAMLALPASALADGAISGSATCASGAVTVSWSYFEDAPFGHLEWIGYDIYRRAPDACGDLVRLNAFIIPRSFGNHSRSWNDTPPESEKLYEYQVLPVDANHHPLPLYGMLGQYFVSCPMGSAPVAQGTLVDYGWALFVQPCPGNCTGGYVEYPSEALRSLAGTGTAVRLFGTVYCGTIEGCAIQVDHYDLADCAPVPTLPATWGKLKANYR